MAETLGNNSGIDSQWVHLNFKKFNHLPYLRIYTIYQLDRLLLVDLVKISAPRKRKTIKKEDCYFILEP